MNSATKNISSKSGKAANEVSSTKIPLCAEEKDPEARIDLELNFARFTAYLPFNGKKKFNLNLQNAHSFLTL